MTRKNALITGNSDGIGARVTKRLLDLEYQVTGLSKSPSSIVHSGYTHIVEDVSAMTYRKTLSDLVDALPDIDVCIHCAGIGELLDLDDLASETKTFEVNLMGAVVTTEIVVAAMIARGHGHFIGLSSVADSLISAGSPSYSASKAGIASFWEGLGIAVKQRNVKISTIRFGFVDTKMAKSKKKPFMLTVDQSVDFLLGVIERPRLRASYPKTMALLVWLMGLNHRVFSIAR